MNTSSARLDFVQLSAPAGRRIDRALQRRASMPATCSERPNTAAASTPGVREDAARPHRALALAS